jgi:phosphohistidine phosphatase SixA
MIRPTIGSPDVHHAAGMTVSRSGWLVTVMVVMASLLAAPAANAHADHSTAVKTTARSEASISPRTDIWQQLRTGRGYAVLLRHALAPGSGDPAGFRLGDCSTQRNLSSEGRRQAIAIGAQWRRERLPVDRVLTSRWCRARDTARLLAVGKVTAYPALDSSFTVSESVASRRTAKVRALIERHEGQPGVLVLVGHQVNITDITGIAPPSGGAVVVQARPGGTLRVVGMLPAP